MEVDGKPYGLNPMKMLRKTSVTDKPSYFCSDLVASAYKRLQLLPESVSTGEYLPTTFAQSSNLQLLYGKLEDEILIEFHKNEVAESRTASTSSGLTAEQHRQLAKWMHPSDRGSVPSIVEEKQSYSPSPLPNLPEQYVPRRRASSIPTPATQRASSADALLAILKSMDDLDGIGQPALNSSASSVSSSSSTPPPTEARTSHSSVEEEWDASNAGGRGEAAVVQEVDGGAMVEEALEGTVVDAVLESTVVENIAEMARAETETGSAEAIEKGVAEGEEPPAEPVTAAQEISLEA